MLQTLAIRGYRGFESYRLVDLARVNLVVGKNNCGKTSVLEAIELLISGGHPSVFLSSLARRGEGAGLREFSSDVSHIFFGHKCVPGASFSLSSDDTKRTLSARYCRWKTLATRSKTGFKGGCQLGTEEDTPMFVISFDRSSPESRSVLPVMEVMAR